MPAREVVDNLDELLEILPERLAERLRGHLDREELIEIVMDVGRKPEARTAEATLLLSERPVTREDLQHVEAMLGDFGADNRAGIERTLHRISAMRNRRGEVVGLTLRVGRAVYGTLDIIQDVVREAVSERRSILLLGRPGIGKTTLLREAARVLADEFEKRVVIVDTSNEIGGDGDVPHPAVGRARRMQVPHPTEQAEVMIEAVENHMPEVVVIDEIGRAGEADAARTIAERGVLLIGTAHGNTLENLIQNPTLADLIGGIQAVTLGDDEARRRGSQKTVLERKAPPTFDIVIEIRQKSVLAIHHDVGSAVDALLAGRTPRVEIRSRLENGEIEVTFAEAPESISAPPEWSLALEDGAPRNNGARRRLGAGRAAQAAATQTAGGIKLYPFGVSRNLLERTAAQMHVPIEVVDEVHGADAVVTSRAQYRKMPQRLLDAEARGLRIFVVRSNTPAHMRQVLAEIMPGGGESDAAQALSEAEHAIQTVKLDARPIDLPPRNPYLRKLQHELIARFQLRSTSVGRDPYRRVRVLPQPAGSGRW
ncbi:MAG TPA: R3H domain-containing nucleic acid-binding protein [Limnochordia bacterium]|nr:R3H domain-containing nucleic acid-binding protein [Limnochordia bacterium]